MVMGIMSVISIANIRTFAFAENDILITFDVDKPRLDKYMPDEVTDGIDNITRTYSSGDRVEFPIFPNAINTYYTHSWSVDGVVTIDSSNYFATKSQTINIKWQPIEYNVYYNYVTPAEKSEIVNLQEIDTYSVEKQIVYYYPSRPHYKFVDWYSSSEFLDGQIEVYTDRYARGDKYLYAKWKPVIYNINYNTDANNLDNPPNYTYDTPTFDLAEPSKEGHIFLGWYLDSEFANRISQITNHSYGDINLYPKWELKKNTVTYILPDGSSEVVVVEYGKNAPMPSVRHSIFSIITLNSSNKNITEDTQIIVKCVSIWYIYLVGIVIVGAVIAIIIISNKNKEKKMHKLRQKYQSNLKNKRKIR